MELDAEFLLLEIDTIEKLPKIITQHKSLQGFCVTMPYKEKILSYIDHLSPTAKECENVNCVKILRNKQKTELIGYNTDAFGFEHSLINQLNIKEIKQAYILGSGGVSKTIKHILKKHNIYFKLVSRNPKNEEISYSQMNQEFTDYSLFINATPVGMHQMQNQMPDIDLQKLNHTHQIFDLIYNPSPTLLMKESIKRGAKAIDGSQMLFYQAEKAWEIWQSK